MRKYVVVILLGLAIIPGLSIAADTNALMAQILQLQSKLAAMKSGGGSASVSSGCLQITRTLKQGMKDKSSKVKDVTGLQKFLKAKGFFTGTVGGAFGPKTKSSVAAFQRANKIRATGIVDTSTRKAIRLSSCSGGGAINGTLRLLDPSDPMIVYKGQVKTIKWSVSGNVGPVNIELRDYSLGSPKVTTIASGVDGNAGSYNWNVPLELPIGSKYSIVVSNGPSFDESKFFFTVGMRSGGNWGGGGGGGGGNVSTGCTPKVSRYWFDINNHNYVSPTNNACVTNGQREFCGNYAVEGLYTAATLSGGDDSCVSKLCNVYHYNCTGVTPSTISFNSDFYAEVQSGTLFPITWDDTNPADNYSLYLNPINQYTENAPLTGETVVTNNILEQAYDWIAGLVNINNSAPNVNNHSYPSNPWITPTGVYNLKLCHTGSNSGCAVSPDFYIQPARPLRSPTASSSVALGSNFTVDWSGNSNLDGAFVKLYKGDNFISDLGKAGNGTKVFTWPVSSSLSAGNNYQIRVLADFNDLITGGEFAISDIFKIGN